jgi:hypothetical protein
MKISNPHQLFSEYLREPRALTNPEDFLGPNWEDVINFWLYVDGLSEDETRKIRDRYWALDDDVREFARATAHFVAEEIVGEKVRDAIWYANYWRVFGDATLELLAHHKLLEQGETLIALPLCLNP